MENTQTLSKHPVFNELLSYADLKNISWEQTLSDFIQSLR